MRIDRENLGYKGVHFNTEFVCIFVGPQSVGQLEFELTAVVTIEAKVEQIKAPSV
jgi:hypothetical protein